MRRLTLFLTAFATTLLVACAPQAEPGASGASEEPTTAAEPEPADVAEATEAPDACAPENLATQQPGKLTVATGEPAFGPWVIDNKPESGKGFEAAVAYAVAKELGFAKQDVTWTRADFNASIQPGAKSWDFNLQQFSITKARRKAVDFSSPYYDAQQTVIAVGGTPAAKAKSIADLKNLKMGAQVGTTSLDAIEQIVQPTAQPGVYNTNDEARTALENGQIDALVVDLPTAFFMVAVQLDNGAIVGQLPEIEGKTDQFGLVLDKGSPLTDCVSRAVDALREDGTLDDIEAEWLGAEDAAPVLE